MRNIVIIGDSGHAKVVADVVNATEKMKVCAKLDDKYTEVFVEDGILKGPVSHLQELTVDDFNLGVLIGIGSNVVRKKISEKLTLEAARYISAIHPTAIVSPSAQIGVGTVIMPGTIVNADAQIGDHVIINSGSVVEHECVVGNYGHISPLAALTGGVRIGEGTHIGAGASIIPMKTVGDWTTVGAGTVVVSDIESHVTVVGSPAKVVKKEGL